MEEFELTYLPQKEVLLKIKNCPFKVMVDIYIPELSEHPTLRIRKSGEKYEITKKQPVYGNDSSHQLETTITLTKEEYGDLNLVKGKRVSKNRYIYKDVKYTYEIDVFQEELKGLILVDVEFGSNEEKAKFVHPDWMLADVTQEKFIAGGMLCGKSYKDIANELKKFKYTKINLSK